MLRQWLSRLALGLSLLASACSRVSGEAPAVFVLGVDDRTSGTVEGLRVDTERAGRLLSQAFADQADFHPVSEPEPEAFRAELVISLCSERRSERDDEQGLQRTVQVELKLRRRVEGGVEELSATGQAFEVQDPSDFDRTEGFERVLGSAIDRAVSNVGVQLRSEHLSLDELLAKLGSPRPEERLYVLRTLRERRDPSLVPQVILALSDSDDAVVLEAIGVLVAQGDPLAVEPLIKLAFGRDVLFQLQIITAVGELGGPVARGYLFTLARGHGSSEVRERAAEALARLERRTGQKAAAETLAGTARPDGGGGR